MQQREVQLNDTELRLFKKMNIMEQVAVKRLMWQISDVSEDQKAADFWTMLEALFQGAYIKYEGASKDQHYKYD